MDKQILSEFKKFLFDKKFIPEKNTPFYAYWVNKFLYFSNNTEILPADARIKKFLDQLSAKAETTDNIMGPGLTISLFIFPPLSFHLFN